MVIRGRTGPSRRRTLHLTDILPNIHLRYDRATAEGAHHQKQLETRWRSLTSDNEETSDQGEGGQLVQGGGENDAEEPCTYCGRALDDSAEDSEDNHEQVPRPCAHGGLLHACCMLDRAEHLARGYADPRRCIASRSAWPGGNRPPHPVALARGLPIAEQGQMWAVVRGALQFVALFQRGVPGPGAASYATASAHSTFDIMVSAHERSPTSSFLLCSLFCDALRLPRGAYLDFPRLRGWNAIAGHYRVLFAARELQT